jgi:hypothetical protein
VAKTKEAENQFEPGVEYLAKVLDVRWAAQPTVGEDEPNLSVRIKLSIICTHDPEAEPEFLGLEAVHYVPVDHKRNPRLAAREFLKQIGVKSPVARTGDAGIEHAKWVICRFGEADPIHKYQSITEGKPADEAGVGDIIRRVFDPDVGGKSALRLRFPAVAFVQRGSKRIELDSPLSWYVLKRLWQRHPDPYRAEDLCDHAWGDAKIPVPRGYREALYRIVHILKKSVKQLELDIPRATRAGYRLRDLRRT